MKEAQIQSKLSNHEKRIKVLEHGIKGLIEEVRKIRTALYVMAALMASGPAPAVKIWEMIVRLLS